MWPFLNWWSGVLPSGIVGAVFPSLAGILLKEDDVDVLSVATPAFPHSLPLTLLVFHGLPLRFFGWSVLM